MTDYVAQGWNGYAGWGDQSALATAAATSKYNAVESIQISEKRPATPMKDIRQGRQLISRSLGNITADVSASGSLYPDDYASSRIFENICNLDTVSGSSTAGYTHVFAESSAIANFKLFGETIHAHQGGQNTNTLKRAVGAFLKSFSLNSPESGPLKWNASYIARSSDNAAGSLATAAYSTVLPFESWMCTVKIGDSIAGVAAIDVKDWTFSVEMNPKLIFQQGGATNGRYATKIIFGQPTYSVTMNKLTEDDFNTYYAYFSSDALKSIVLDVLHTTLAGSSTGYHQITIALPRMMIDEENSGLNGTDDQSFSLKFTALKGLVDTLYACNITVVNSTAGTY